MPLTGRSTVSKEWIERRKTPAEIRALWPVCYAAVAKTIASDISDVNKVVLELSYQLHLRLCEAGRDDGVREVCDDPV